MAEQTESEARRLHENLVSLIDKALEADTTSDMATLAGYAQAATVELKDFLQDAVDAGSTGSAPRGAIEDAIGTLSQAAIEAEKVALGTDVSSMRRRVEDFKAAVDDASSRLQKAFGW